MKRGCLVCESYRVLKWRPAWFEYSFTWAAYSSQLTRFAWSLPNISSSKSAKDTRILISELELFRHFEAFWRCGRSSWRSAATVFGISSGSVNRLDTRGLWSGWTRIRMSSVTLELFWGIMTEVKRSRDMRASWKLWLRVFIAAWRLVTDSLKTLSTFGLSGPSATIQTWCLCRIASISLSCVVNCVA